MDNILVKFDVDTSSIPTAVEQLEQIEGVDKQLAESALKVGKAIQEKNKAISDSATSTKKGFTDLMTAVNNADKAVLGMSYKKVLQEIGSELNKTGVSAKNFFKTVADESKKGIVSAQTKEDLDSLNELLAAATESLNEMGTAEDKAGGKTVSLRQKLRQMKEELATIDDKGSPRFTQLATQAAELEDRLGDVNEQVKLLASDTSTIDAVIQGMTGLAGSFAIAQGAMALFGGESDDLQQALLKVNAAMSILNGIQQVGTVIDKNSALNIFLLKTLRLQDAEAAQIQAEANQELAVSEEEAAVASKGLTAAMAANPAATLLIAISALAAALYAFADEENQAIKISKDFEEVNTSAAKSIQKEEIDLQSLLVVARNDVASKQDRLAAIDAINKKMPDYIGKLTLENVTTKEGSAIIDEYVKHLSAKALAQAYAAKLEDLFVQKIELENSAISDNIHWYQALWQTIKSGGDITEASLKSVEKAEQNRKERLAGIQAEINALQKRYQADLQTGKAQLDFDQDIADAHKEMEEKAKAQAEKNSQALFEIIQRRLQQQAELYKSFSETNSFGYDFRLQSLQTYIDKETALINLQRQRDLSAENLTALQKQNINEKYDLELRKIIEDGYSRRNAIIKSKNEELNSDSEKFYKEQEDAEGKLIAKVLQNIKDQYSQYNENNKQDFLKGNIDYEEFQKRNLDNTISSLQAQLEVTGLSAEERSKIEDDLINAIVQKEQEGAQQHQQTEQEKTKVTEAEAQKRKQIQSAQFDLLSTAANGYFNYLNTLYQDDLTNAQQLKDRKLISEVEYNRRVAQVKRQQAIAQKEEGLFSVAISVAKAIANDLAGNKFMIPYDIAMGVLESALIAAQPIPKYKTGKIKIDGSGTETSDSILAMLSKNESVINAAGTNKMLANYPGALEAINNLKFDEWLSRLPPMTYMHNIPLPNVPHMNISTPDLPKDYTFSHTAQMDYKKLAEMIGQNVAAHVGRLADIPGINVNIDEKGIAIIVRKENELIDFQNKRYSS